MAEHDIDAQVEKQLAELQDNVRSILSLENDIKEGKAAHEGVAELKETVNQISTRNAELIDKLKAAQEDQKGLRSDLTDRLDELEVSLKDRQGRKATRSAAAYFADEISKRWDTRDRRRVSVRMDDEADAMRSMRAITNASASAGQVITPDFDEDMVFVPRETPKVADLITTFPTTSDTVIDRREQAHAGAIGPNAGSQAGQGTTKPESDYAFENATYLVQTIGHFQTVSTQALDDRARLEAEIRFMMQRDLALELDRQVLYGGGSASNELDGMVPNATAYDGTLETGVVDGTTTQLDRVRVSMLQIQLGNLIPSAIVLDPTGWAQIELTKDTDNDYIFVNVQNQTAPRLWGLPVVSTTVLDADDLLVADLVSAVRLYDRQQPSVRISEEHGTNFTDNNATILTEMRCAQSIRYSSGIIYYAPGP